TRAAAQIGLAAPRFLLRLPYGEDGDPCESIHFEEMPAGKPDPASYCWGNPAALMALLLGQSFAEYGLRFRPGIVRDVDHLPLHVYEFEGESISQPCGEILLTERAADRLLERGIMPIASMKDSDTVRVVRFQSVADPATTLAGRWA
ncbi:MAG: type VI secretion system contractile sheath domain-containing protein, partial [Bryobacteraceae bacterium]